jgi:hypothetical protein
MLLFDHLVGDGDELCLHLDAQQRCGLSVDNKLEIARSHDLKIGRLCPLKDFAGVEADLSKNVRIIDATAHQPTSGNCLAIAITSRDTLACRHGGKLVRRLLKNVSGATKRASSRSLRTVPKAVSIPAVVLARRTRN